MNIRYESSRAVTDAEFVDLLKRSTLGERRPIGDSAIITGMLRHADLLCTAWHEDKLVGIARSVTDFQYCCYLSDLAVDEAYQKMGIGTELIRLTQYRLGPKAFIVLLAAPKAEKYYPRLGFNPHHSCWILPAGKTLGKR